jgi:dCTP deaminase
MMLGRAAILDAMKLFDLGIEPFVDSQLRSASYVLRLGRRFRRARLAVQPIHVWSANAADDRFMEIEEASELCIPQGDFVLAATHETVRLPDRLAGAISPLSHIARFGLSVTCGADHISPGYGSNGGASLTLELVNNNPTPLRLSAGMPIAHLRLYAIEGGDPVHRRSSIYEGRDPLSAPMLFEEWSSALSHDL